MYDLSIFTQEEREAGLEVIDKIARLVDYARKEGIFGMEAILATETDDFLAIAMQLLINCTAPEQVRQILQVLISAEGYKGADLLRCILIIEGVLSIQAAEQPKIIEKKLLCHLGVHFLRQRGHLGV